MKRLLLAFVGFIVVLFLLLFNYRPAPKELTKYLVKPTANNNLEGELFVQFLGNTNLLFSDGKTAILTDGFFSRPSAFKVLLGKVAPDEQEIKRCLEKAGIQKLDAVIPVHSHFDHALDAPVVARMTGAKLIGSMSTFNIGKGCGLHDTMMIIPPLNKAISIGKFKITFIKSAHWQYPDEKQRERLLNCEITSPLIPPASIFDYKEGDSYTILIEYDSIKLAIQGSAGYKEGSIQNFDANILFVAIAGLEVMDETYNQNYQEHLIEPLSPEILVPIHWDDFTIKLGAQPKTTNMLFNLKYGSNLGNAFKEIEQRNLGKGRTIKILPLWDQIEINTLLTN